MISPYVEFAMWEVVYLKTDIDRNPRLIMGYKVSASFIVTYLLTCGLDETYHYFEEITTNKYLEI